MDTASIFEEKLCSILGPEQFRAATREETICGLRPQFFAEPSDEEQIAALLACANEAGLAVIPRGGGTKLSWGNPPKRSDLILSTARVRAIREHAWADLTVVVEAGCPLQTLQEKLAVHGQRLALDALWPDQATIGGVLATNDSGALRLRFGALRDLIIGVTIALPDGKIASSGGKVVKNVAGYDLPKLATGALGTLGVITRAVFRLHPLPGSSRTFSFTAGTFEEMRRLILAIQDSQLAHTALQIRCGTNSPPAADILFEATEAGLSAQESRLQNLLGAVACGQSSARVWETRQELLTVRAEDTLLAKFSILPFNLSSTMLAVEQIARSQSLRWQLVVHATGVGTLRLKGDSDALRTAVEQLRMTLESGGGSLVLLHRPAELAALDAWGSPGDAIALMRAVKNQLDPKGTLNPGRFVGGI